MANIFELRPDGRTSQNLPQQYEILSNLVNAKVLESFRIIEHEVIPLLSEINVSIKHTIRDAISGQLPDGTVESAKSAEKLATEIQMLATSYRNILVPA